MAEPKQLTQARVRDYMTPDPQTLDINSTLLDAVLLIRRAELRHIPILQDGRLVGILTDRDVGRVSPSVLGAVSPQEYNRFFEETPLGKVMSRNLVSIAPEAPLAEAVNLLYKNKLGCLPVLDGEHLIGIITVLDMLRALHDLIGAPDAAGQG